MEATEKDVKKDFDSIATMRRIRDEISFEIMNMTFEEEQSYIDKLLSGAKDTDSN